MYVGRRSSDEDAETFVIQASEEGRRRLSWPDLGAAESIEPVIVQAQESLTGVLGAPVPLCPLHEHALVGKMRDGRLFWLCPERRWSCRLGDYEELTWPQLDAASLAPILSQRLQRRGIDGVSVGVRRSEQGLIADFGVPEVSSELTEALTDAAAPLPVSVHNSSLRLLRPRPLSQ
jgi:hypothetical protein